MRSFEDSPLLRLGHYQRMLHRKAATDASDWSQTKIFPPFEDVFSSPRTPLSLPFFIVYFFDFLPPSSQAETLLLPHRRTALALTETKFYVSTVKTPPRFSDFKRYTTCYSGSLSRCHALTPKLNYEMTPRQTGGGPGWFRGSGLTFSLTKVSA